MNFELLENALQRAQCTCPPDEYQLRQRNLLHTVAQYIIDKEIEAAQISEGISA